MRGCARVPRRRGARSRDLLPARIDADGERVVGLAPADRLPARVAHPVKGAVAALVVGRLEVEVARAHPVVQLGEYAVEVAATVGEMLAGKAHPPVLADARR